MIPDAGTPPNAAREEGCRFPLARVRRSSSVDDLEATTATIPLLDGSVGDVQAAFAFGSAANPWAAMEAVDAGSLRLSSELPLAMALTPSQILVSRPYERSESGCGMAAACFVPCALAVAALLLTGVASRSVWGPWFGHG